MAKDKKKKWFFIIFFMLILGAILFFGLKMYWPKTNIVKKNLNALTFSPASFRRGGSGGSSGTVEATPAEDILEELDIILEPLDEECIGEHIDCILDYEDEFTGCLDMFFICTDICDETFPITDEIEECWDGCDEVYEITADICDEIIDEHELDECYDDAEDAYDECDIDCDSEFIECSIDCGDEIIAPCVEVLIDSVYECLEECMIGEETVVWDGTEITDIGEFYETSFPQFIEQFTMVCEWFGAGDYVATENKFGCENMMFWTEWLAPYMQSIESAKTVCETIGGTWIMNSEEMSCNI